MFVVPLPSTMQRSEPSDCAASSSCRRAMVATESGYGVEHPVFWIDRFHPHGTRQHTAFVARSCAEVDAFHAAGVRTGGTDNGKPGLRDHQGHPRGYYAAIAVDPDGNNMEAVFRMYGT